MTYRLRWLIAFVAVAALVLSACGGGEDPDDSVPQLGDSAGVSEEVAEESAPPLTPAEEAVAALETYLEFRDEAILEGRLDLEGLNEVATGHRFLDFQHEIVQNIEWGHEFTGEYKHELGEPQGDGSGTYVIVVCEDATQVRRTGVDGEEVEVTGPDGEPVPDRRKIEYHVEAQDDGRLLVSLLTLPVDETGRRTVQSC